MKILSGTSNPSLSKSISKHLKLKLVNTNIKKFADGEIYVEINENIRGNSVFVIQATATPANDNLMELLLCIDALRRSSAKNITAVIPYFGYARQDRKVVPKTSISAKLVSNLITNSGAQEDDAIVLTKPLVTGIISTAIKRSMASNQMINQSVKCMTTLNANASILMKDFDANSETGVTGFGLLGHLTEMCSASRLTAEIQFQNLPF